MRNFGGFIDDEEDDDQYVQQDDAQQQENRSDSLLESQTAADPVIGSDVANAFFSTILQDQRVLDAAGSPAVEEARKPSVQHNTAAPVVTTPKNHQRPAPHAPAPTPAPAKTYPTQSAVKNFKNSPKPAPAKRRNRYAGHYEFNNLVREDWQRAIEDDHYAFDALIYLPEVAEYTPVEAKHHETAEFTEISNNQRELVYGLPHPVVVLDCPDERENFFAVDDDGDQDGGADDFLVLRVAATGIPIGSVFEWLEEQADGSTLPRWWYVMKIFAYGTASVGSLYFCVPARNFEGSDPQKVNRDAS